MKVHNTLKEYLLNQPLITTNALVVAYSGGVDSHVLLHALSELRNEGFIKAKLHAIHIHHGLSQDADKWQQHCQQICDRLNVSFQTAKVEITNTSRTSLEAAAREVRYKKIIELAPECSQVLLGQHQDDQLETFFLQLKRGAGPKGLSAMNQAWTVEEGDKTISFFRPLLDVSQQNVLDYAHQYQLNWCEDESNQNTDFERNFLRHDVLPILQNRWPELAKSVSRSALLCSQQQDLLEEVCAEKLVKLQTKDNSLHIVGLNELSTHWLHQVVRYWLSEQSIQSPSLAVIERLQPEVLNAADDATPILQWQGWQFRRFNQQLYVITAQDKIEPISIQWNGQEEIELPQSLGALRFDSKDCVESKGVRLNSTDGEVSVSLGSYNKRFKPAGVPHSKPLKQWFKLWQVPPWKRDCVVQLVQSDRIIALLMDGEWVVSNQGAESTIQDQSNTVTVSYLP